MNHYLVADIGGTNVRVALVTGDGNEIYGIEQYAARDYDDLGAVLKEFLHKAQCIVPPKQACFAVACPVLGDQVSLTNNSWSFSIEDMKNRLGLEVLHVINDFDAIARSLPYLGAHDLVQLGTGEGKENRAKAVLGPGTGLGMGALVPAYPRAVSLPSEGGHSAFAPQTEEEEAIVHFVRQRSGFVTNEDLLSGPGLANIYQGLAAFKGLKVAALDPALITARALSGEDPACVEALDRFCGILGAVAGDFALQLGAEGGVYLAGGILPRFLEFLEKSPFRRRFEAKGSYASYVAAIPTYVIIGTQPGLIGAASIFDEDIAQR